VKLSAAIITYNEEINVVRCLKSVSFCDEIVIVDSGSSDKTLELARGFTDKIYCRKWEGYASQKNYALSLCANEWVLSVDADEEVSQELRDEVLSVLQCQPGVAGFSCPRRTMHLGRWIRHGGWYPNRLVRLFNKNQGRWVGGEVHEYWESNGEFGALNGHLLHYSFRNLADQVERNNHYSSLAAVALKREGHHFSYPKLLIKSTVKFFETYVVKRGFLDGYPGLIISVSAAYSVFLKWAKLWELEKSEG